MERRHEVFRQAVVADLTGKQYKVLLRLLSNEVDGEIVVKQSELAVDLDMTESNVSSSIKAVTRVAHCPPSSEPSRSQFFLLITRGFMLLLEALLLISTKGCSR